MHNFIKTHDGRLNSDNYLFELTIEDYYILTKDKLEENRYQRKRVRNSSSLYALLGKDLIEGCLMPPIVLAYEGIIDESQDILQQLLQSNKILILDGLQRSYTIRDLVDENQSALFDGCYSKFKDNKIRIELYTGINRTSLLYRMLTLNTGQTRMSTRHQIEIIYSDYLNSNISSEIKLVTALDGNKPIKLGVYSFRDAVEGFTSFLMQDYLLLDRLDILENVRELERLTNMTSSEKDLFVDFIETYTHFVRTIHESVGDKLSRAITDKWGNEDDYNSDSSIKFTPFGFNALEIFNKSQALTGFGCAIAKLKERGDIDSFNKVDNFINQIDTESTTDGLINLIDVLEKIRPHAKKIGNDQRFVFYNFFKVLFDGEISSRNIGKASAKAWGKYQREFL